MSSCDLPEGYRFSGRIDLRRDRRAVLVVGIGQMISMILLGLAGFTVLPGEMVPWKNILVQLAVLCLSALCCSAIHELLHGVFMQQKAGRRTKYRLIGWRWYAVNEAYFGKRAYRWSLLLPPVLLTMGNMVLLILIAGSWKWMAYVLLILNIAMAWEDFYLASSLRGIPREALVRHSGTGFEIYMVQK